MKQFLAGVALGALGMGLGLNLLRPSAPPSPGEASVQAPVAGAPAAASAPLPQALTASAPIAAAASAAAQAAPPLAPVPPKAQLTAPAAALYAPLPALGREHQALVNPSESKPAMPTLQELHQQLQQEPTDPNWALRVEAELTAFLALHAQPPAFESLGASCRLSLCRVPLYVNTPDGNGRAQLLVEQLRQAPWFSNEFRNTSFTSQERNGRTTVMLILQRAPR